MTLRLGDHDQQVAIDALVQRFFAAFDNRDGRIPRIAQITALFADKAVVAIGTDDGCELSSVDAFASPRIALLVGGALTGFHEWEDSASTQIAGNLACRTSRYAKSGMRAGQPCAGAGTKFFQLARCAAGWRIVALSWIDDDPRRAPGAVETA